MMTERSTTSDLTHEHFIKFLERHVSIIPYLYVPSSVERIRDLFAEKEMPFHLVGAFLNRINTEIPVIRILGKDTLTAAVGLGNETFNNGQNGVVIQFEITPKPFFSVIGIRTSQLRNGERHVDSVANLFYTPSTLPGQRALDTMINTDREKLDKISGGHGHRFDPNYTLYLTDLMRELAQPPQPVRSTRK